MQQMLARPAIYGGEGMLAGRPLGRTVRQLPRQRGYPEAWSTGAGGRQRPVHRARHQGSGKKRRRRAHCKLSLLPLHAQQKASARSPVLLWRQRPPLFLVLMSRGRPLLKLLLLLSQPGGQSEVRAPPNLRLLALRLPNRLRPLRASGQRPPRLVLLLTYPASGPVGWRTGSSLRQMTLTDQVPPSGRRRRVLLRPSLTRRPARSCRSCPFLLLTGGLSKTCTFSSAGELAGTWSPSQSRRCWTRTPTRTAPGTLSLGLVRRRYV